MYKLERLGNGRLFRIKFEMKSELKKKIICKMDYVKFCLWIYETHFWWNNILNIKQAMQICTKFVVGRQAM